MVTVKEADQIFGRLISWQRIYHPRQIASFIDYVDEIYCANLISACNKNELLNKSIINLFENNVNDNLCSEAVMVKRKVLAKKLLALIDTNIPALLTYLKNHHFANSDLNQSQAVDTPDNVINQYALLLNTLFYHENKFIQSEYLFCLGNLFFEYCFSGDTSDEFFAMLNNEADYPLARLIYAILWEFLSADGWCHWHADSLALLRQESEAGKTIVYIAGGIDIYQLLKHGIYNIEVIDPLYPSQASGYYAEGWSWLVEHENNGDQVNITEDVMIRRERHESFGIFHVTMPNGELFDIEHADTTWAVCNRHSSLVLGSIVFKRRFAVQDDFVFNPAKLLLLSFNELYLLSAPSNCVGWGIDADALSDDTMMVVKQLANPITAAAFKKLTKTNDVPFKFVNLGACAI